MADATVNNDKLAFNEEDSRLPSGLNTLTILTMIGCAFVFFGSLYNFFFAQKNLDKTREMLDSDKLANAPSWAKGMISPDTLAMQQKMLDNKMPILILSLVSVALCLYGALEMRKRKKQGYILYVIGEILPLAINLFFIGVLSFKGFGLLLIVVPVLFIILYTARRKDLIY